MTESMGNDMRKYTEIRWINTPLPHRIGGNAVRSA
jgi:hypothetical protein